MRARVVVVSVVLLAVVAGGAFAVWQGVAPDGRSRDADVSEPEPMEITDPVAEPAAEPEPAPEPEPTEAELLTDAPVVSATSESDVSVTAPDGFLATEAFAQLDAEIAALRNQGYSVGVSLVDLQTGRSISYNADERLYPASSIKALYCAMVCETSGGSGGMADVMERCLVDSSNEDYEALIGAYGMPAFGAWLGAHGATEAAYDGSIWYYPDISADELAACWQEIYRFGTSDEAGGAELAGYLARTNYTPAGALLRDECEVWAKPGWFPDNGELVATNDAGVVFSESGPYVFVVMTDLSADLDGLTPLLAALDEAHDVMCGSATT